MLGIIGGSGLYDIEGLTHIEWLDVESAFGKPSDRLLKGKLNGSDIVFLPRHGREHTLSPSKINYRANIDVLKKVGVNSIVSVSAVGSLSDKLNPGSVVIVDQFIDRTFAREKSFFSDCIAAHVSMADPVCACLAEKIEISAKKFTQDVTKGGTYLVMEGPQFSTRAESRLYRSWQCDVIGMTNMPEAKLAREAEICYATIAMVTDYDCWHPDHDDVDVNEVIKNLKNNIHIAKKIIQDLVVSLDINFATKCDRGCNNSLDNAVMTSPSSFRQDTLKALEAVAGRVLKKEN